MSRIELGNLVINPDMGAVYVGARRVPVTMVELDLLHELARGRGKVISREKLIQKVWKARSEGDILKLNVYVYRLRKKLADSYPWQIETFKNRGYAMVTEAKPPALRLIPQIGPGSRKASYLRIQRRESA